jgi:hypothetical protein
MEDGKHACFAGGITLVALTVLKVRTIRTSCPPQQVGVILLVEVDVVVVLGNACECEVGGGGFTEEGD